MRPLWTCPRCGKQFVNPNSYHSCLNWPLEKHFEGKGRARELFESFKVAIETTGPVTLVSNKTNLGFMTRARFVGCTPRKDYLDAHVWLKRAYSSPRVRRGDPYGPRDFVIRFAIRSVQDIDAEIRALIAEARLVGDQRHAHQMNRYRA